MSNSDKTPPQSRSSGSFEWKLSVSPLVYDGSGPEAERDDALCCGIFWASEAERDSTASKQGNDIWGLLEASAGATTGAEAAEAGAGDPR